jgi:hypothetical protein
MPENIPTRGGHLPAGLRDGPVTAGRRPIADAGVRGWR